jgi:DNA-binding response OmpR family regulator
MQRSILFGNARTEWRDVCERLFSAAGFVVGAASDGLTCLAKLRTFMPDVIIVDVDMLWGGGDGLIAWLLEESDPWSTPLVFVIGGASAETLSSRTGVPADFCLQRPLAPSSLLEAVCHSLVPIHRS